MSADNSKPVSPQSCLSRFSRQQGVSRRGFLKMVGAAGGGLIVGINLTGCGAEPLPEAIEQSAYVPNAFLQIKPSGAVHLYLPSNEMGQGAWTGLTTLVAEELNTPPERIEVTHSGIHDDYVNPQLGFQGTGGSTAIRGFYIPLRQAAANARESLRQAAATQLAAKLSTVTVVDGQVDVAGKRYHFGEFVDQAMTLPPVTEAALKDPADFRYIGKQNRRLDNVDKCTGVAQFGIDIDMPEMRKVAIKRCPVIRGRPVSFNEQQVSGLPGVEAIVTLDNGVAVVAGSYWQARKAVDALQVEWDLPKLAQYNTEKVFAEMRDGLAREEGDEAEKRGEGAAALEQASATISAEYQLPYLAHATMEPMNCAVRIENDICDVWTGTQFTALTRDCAARYSGLPQDNINIHCTFLGGGFGRRSHLDFVAEAVQVATKSGLPVQVVWSREDDMQNDYYRPASVVKMSAGYQDDGTISVWRADRAGGNILPYLIDDMVDHWTAGVLPLSLADWISKRGYGIFENWTTDGTSVEGLFEDYDFPNMEVRNVTVDSTMRLGFWRSVGASSNTFAKEVFVDEIAAKLGMDPVALRLKNTRGNPRMANVIKLAAEKAGWGTALPEGHALGIAIQKSFEAYVAQIAEVSVENGQIKLHRMICVIDCGSVVNPDNVVAQMESCTIYGATAALYGRIDLEGGAVKQSNFHDYPVLRFDESPQVDVHIVASNEPPGGVGEPGLPPVAPAIANAVFAATGVRRRSLPLQA